MNCRPTNVLQLAHNAVTHMVMNMDVRVLREPGMVGPDKFVGNKFGMQMQPVGQYTKNMGKVNLLNLTRIHSLSLGACSESTSQHQINFYTDAKYFMDIW